MVFNSIGYLAGRGNLLVLVKSQKANAGMSLRLLQPSGDRVYLRAGRGAEVFGEDFGAFAGPDRYSCGGGAGAVQGVVGFEGW